MSAVFVAASSQYLTNAASVITATPFSCGAWCYLASATLATYISIGDTGSSNHFWAMQINSTAAFQFYCIAGGSARIATAGTPTTGAWHYLVARAVSPTNRWISALRADGVIAHGQNTTERIPTGVDAVLCGAQAQLTPTNQVDGYMAEFWLTNTDIQPDGAQLNDDLLRQLAYGGPFSIPHIAKDLIEYRSFRKVIESDQDCCPGDEVYWGGAGRQVWTNTNGVTRGPHPPLPGWYRKPNAALMTWQNQARTYNWFPPTAVGAVNRIRFPAQTSAMGVGGMLGGNRIN
jgi:hypothetical protein